MQGLGFEGSMVCRVRPRARIVGFEGLSYSPLGIRGIPWGFFGFRVICKP